MGFNLAMAITCPANTTFANRKRDDKKIPAGSTIDSVVLHVPLGHQAKQPAWFELNGGRLMPSENTEYRMDDVPDLELISAPIRVPFASDFSLVGFNEDLVDAHTTRAFVRGRYARELPFGARFVDADYLRGP